MEGKRCPIPLLSTEARCGPTPDRYFMSREAKSNMNPKRAAAIFKSKGSGYLYIFPVTFRQVNGLAQCLDHRGIIREMRSIRLLISLFQ